MRKCQRLLLIIPETNAASAGEKGQVKAESKETSLDAESSIDAEKKKTIKKLLEEMKHEANLD